MPLSRSDLESMLLAAFPDADLTITDLAGDNDHWSVSIASERFNEKSKVQQHQLVYQALQGKMGTTLHALQLQTTPKSS